MNQLIRMVMRIVMGQMIRRGMRRGMGGMGGMGGRRRAGPQQRRTAPRRDTERDRVEDQRGPPPDGPDDGRA